jgi:hypothetical protein
MLYSVHILSEEIHRLRSSGAGPAGDSSSSGGGGGKAAPAAGEAPKPSAPPLDKKKSLKAA